MKLVDVPVGHIAKSRQSNLLVLVGKSKSYHLNRCMGSVFDNSSFNDDYEDFGELKVNVEEVKQCKVCVSVG